LFSPAAHPCACKTGAALTWSALGLRFCRVGALQLNASPKLRAIKTHRHAAFQSKQLPETVVNNGLPEIKVKYRSPVDARFSLQTVELVRAAWVVLLFGVHQGGVLRQAQHKCFDKLSTSASTSSAQVLRQAQHK
jgi:hypothetical protein